MVRTALGAHKPANDTGTGELVTIETWDPWRKQAFAHWARRA
jgi:hypothetical protein